MSIIKKIKGLFNQVQENKIQTQRIDEMIEDYKHHSAEDMISPKPEFHYREEGETENLCGAKDPEGCFTQTEIAVDCPECLKALQEADRFIDHLEDFRKQEPEIIRPEDFPSVLIAEIGNDNPWISARKQKPEEWIALDLKNNGEEFVGHYAEPVDKYYRDGREVSVTHWRSREKPHYLQKLENQIEEVKGFQDIPSKLHFKGEELPEIKDEADLLDRISRIKDKVESLKKGEVQETPEPGNPLNFRMIKLEELKAMFKNAGRLAEADGVERAIEIIKDEPEKRLFTGGDEIPGPFKYPERDKSRDWTEEFNQENGNYSNNCHVCGNLFFGYKRRITCKLCFNKAEEERVKKESILRTKDQSPPDGFTSNPLERALGLISNLRHETDCLPDQYYEWMDAVLNYADPEPFNYPTTLHDLRTDTPEGKLLLSALGILTGEIRTNKTPDEVLEELIKLSEYIFPETENPTADRAPKKNFEKTTDFPLSAGSGTPEQNAPEQPLFNHFPDTLTPDRYKETEREISDQLDKLKSLIFELNGRTPVRLFTPLVNQLVKVRGIVQKALNEGESGTQKDNYKNADDLKQIIEVPFKAPEYKFCPDIVKRLRSELDREQMKVIKAWETETEIRVVRMIDNGSYHLMISHPDRIPARDEILWSRYEFVPPQISNMGEILNGSERDSKTVHLWEIRKG